MAMAVTDKQVAALQLLNPGQTLGQFLDPTAQFLRFLTRRLPALPATAQSSTPQFSHSLNTSCTQGS
jgi:hypothetical protein